jgi:hypothetical protein
VREKPTQKPPERVERNNFGFVLGFFLLIRERFLARAGRNHPVSSSGAVAFDAFLRRFLLLPLLVVVP